jgi:hypothetical protein
MALLEHGIHQGGLAVVYVGDYGYVSYVFTLHIFRVPYSPHEKAPAECRGLKTTFDIPMPS